jgi:hypothetical protein
MLSTAVATDFRSYLLDDVGSRRGGDAVPLGDVIRTYVFGAPVVRAAYDCFPGNHKETKAQLAVFNGIFNRGPYLWPVPLTANILDCLFRPNVFKDEEMSLKWAPLPTELAQAFEHIGNCFAAMMDAFRSGKVAVVDLDGNQIPIFLWRRPGLRLDVLKSDLYEIDANSEHILHPEPAGTVSSPTASAIVGDPATGSPSVALSTKEAKEPVIAAGGRCLNWLIDLMLASPLRGPKTKEQYLEEARSRFGQVSGRSFDQTWSDAIRRVPGCKWNAQGRRKGPSGVQAPQKVRPRQLVHAPPRKTPHRKPRAN